MSRTTTEQPGVTQSSAREKPRGGTLVAAVLAGEERTVTRLLLEERPHPDAVDDDGLTLLDHAARSSRANVLAALAAYGFDVDHRDPAGRTRLHYAASNGDDKTLSTLLRLGADPNMPTESNGNTPLMLAVAGSHARCTEMLLLAGAELGQCNGSGWSAFDVRSSDHDTLSLLAFQSVIADRSRAPKPLETSRSRVTELMSAVRAGDARAVQQLLLAGAPADSYRPDGAVPLHIACAGGDRAIVSLLLRAGARANVFTYRKKTTPLYVAAYYGHADVVELLLLAGADHTTADHDGWTAVDCVRTSKPNAEIMAMMRVADARSIAMSRMVADQALVNAVRRDDLAAVLRRLNDAQIRGRDVALDGADRSGATPMLYAIGSGGLVSIVSVLLKFGASVSAASPRGYTPVFQAARFGLGAILWTLLSAGADPNAATVARETPLMAAVAMGHSDCVQMLVEFGADCCTTNDRGDVAVSFASAQYPGGLIVLGLEEAQRARGHVLEPFQRRAPLSAPSSSSSSSSSVSSSSSSSSAIPAASCDEELLAAVRHGDLKRVESVLKARGSALNLDATDGSGCSYVHHAARAGFAVVLSALLRHGANAALRDARGRTAAQYAAHVGHVAVLSVLLTAGVGLNAADVCPDAPLLLAAGSGHDDCVQLLLVSISDPESLAEAGRSALKVATERAHWNLAGALTKMQAAGLFRRAADLAAPEPARPSVAESLAAPNNAAPRGESCTWSAETVSRWMASIGAALTECSASFRSSSIEGRFLHELTDVDLGDLGVADPLHRKVALFAIRSLLDDCDRSSSVAAAVPSGALDSTAGRPKEAGVADDDNDDDDGADVSRGVKRPRDVDTNEDDRDAGNRRAH